VPDVFLSIREEIIERYKSLLADLLAYSNQLKVIFYWFDICKINQNTTSVFPKIHLI